MLNIAVIGLGRRGYSLIKNVLMKIDGVQIVSVCDLYEDRIAAAVQAVRDAGGDAKGFTDYRQALNVSGLDAAFIFTGWEMHSEIAIFAMEKGIPAATEVGCEYTLDNCFELVHTQEKTHTPYMFLENCCFGKDELLATSMARKGVFGTIVHCEGAYGHDLRKEIAYGLVNRHYRFLNYKNRCCENYPTHDFGPIAKLLNINRGNRVVSVTSVASKSAGLEEYLASCTDLPDETRQTRFKQGDIIDTLIQCAGGESVHLRLDTSLPRFYNRNFSVRGTKGMYLQATNSVYIDGVTKVDEFEPMLNFRALMNNAVEYEKEYLPAIWKDVTPEALASGHGGMDYFVYKSFLDAVKNHTQVPIDVYDGATWMAISVLSENSIAAGGAPQLMPDFTGGKWYLRTPQDVTDLG